MQEIIKLLFKLANIDDNEVFWFSDDCKELRSEVLNLNITGIPILLISHFDTGRFYRKSELEKIIVDYIEAASC